MIVNVTYPDKETRKRIRERVGTPFSFIERLRMGGVGTRRMYIKEASKGIFEKFHPMHEAVNCNFEIRPKGIIVRFISGIETLAWVISFEHLSISINNEEATFSDSIHHLTVHNTRNDDDVVKIARKCITLQESGSP